jgi:hypothetical protein
VPARALLGSNTPARVRAFVCFVHVAFCTLYICTCVSAYWCSGCAPHLAAVCVCMCMRVCLSGCARMHACWSWLPLQAGMGVCTQPCAVWACGHGLAPLARAAGACASAVEVFVVHLRCAGFIHVCVCARMYMYLPCLGVHLCARMYLPWCAPMCAWLLAVFCMYARRWLQHVLGGAFACMRACTTVFGYASV